MSETSGQQNIETVLALYDAYASRDVDALLAPLDDEVEIYQSEDMPWGGTYKGKEGMMQFVQGITSHIDSVVVVEEMIDAGGTVIMIGKSRGTIKASGDPYEVRLIDVVKMRDGKILKLGIYLDAPPMIEAFAK